MSTKFRYPQFLGISLALFVTFFFISCSNSNYRQSVSVEQRLVINPPSMVEKLWLARHHYDEERRLIVPKIGGARWGAVREYTADGNLIYREWWKRNLKDRDLEAVPTTDIDFDLTEDDTASRPPSLGFPSKNVEAKSDNIAPIPDSLVEENPIPPSQPSETDSFAPLPIPESDDSNPSTEGNNPFAPLAPMEQGSEPSVPAEPSPFGPLPDPF